MVEGGGMTCQPQLQGGRNKGGEPPKENAQDGANWLHQRRDWNRTDQSALRRILMHGRRYKHRPKTQHGDPGDPGRRTAKSQEPGARSPEPGAQRPKPGDWSLQPGARVSGSERRTTAPARRRHPPTPGGRPLVGARRGALRRPEPGARRRSRGGGGSGGGYNGRALAVGSIPH